MWNSRGVAPTRTRFTARRFAPAPAEDALGFAQIVHSSRAVQLFFTKDKNLSTSLFTQPFFFAKVNQEADPKHGSAFVFVNTANVRI